MIVLLCERERRVLRSGPMRFEGYLIEPERRRRRRFPRGLRSRRTSEEYTRVDVFKTE
jgi:hypothetical protein